MMTTAMVVGIVASFGWLFLSWRGYKAGAASEGWSKLTQLKLALIWVALFAGLTLMFGQIQP